MEHTLGDWKFRHGIKPKGASKEADPEYISIVSEDVGRIIAMVGKGWDNAQANAHLISASPRLYKWLKELGLHMAVSYDNDMKPIFTIDNDYLDKRNDILAKAEGSSLEGGG